jgi:hypothetical protein
MEELLYFARKISSGDTGLSITTESSTAAWVTAVQIKRFEEKLASCA